MYLRAVLFWFLLMVLAILNGTLRQYVIIPFAGERVAHWISTVLLSALIVLATGLAWNWLAPSSTAQAWRMGALWLVFTLAFEFLAGHFLFGKAWSDLLADYDLMSGRIWVLVLITTLLAPYIVSLWRGLRAA